MVAPTKNNENSEKKAKKAPKESNTKRDISELLGMLNPHEVQLISRMIYRDAARYAMYVIVALVILLVISLTFNFFLFTTKEVNTLGLYPDGRIVPLTPLTDKKFDNRKIQEFAYRCFPNTYNFDFVHVDDEINRVQTNCFTDTGGQVYVNSLNDNGHTDNIKNNRYITKVMVQELPRITAQGMLGDRYAWRVEALVKIFYDSVVAEPKVDVRVMDVVIVRMPENLKEKGLAINQWNLKLPKA